MTPISWGVDCGKPQGCRGCWSCQPSNGCMFSFLHCVSIFSNSAKKASKAVLEEACRTACCFSSPTRDRINWLLAFCCNTSLATLSTSSLVMKSGLACLSSTATLAMSTRNLFAKKTLYCKMAPWIVFLTPIKCTQTIPKFTELGYWWPIFISANANTKNPLISNTHRLITQYISVSKWSCLFS